MNKYLEKVAARKRMAFIDRHIGEAFGEGPFSIRSKQMTENAGRALNELADANKKEESYHRPGPGFLVRPQGQENNRMYGKDILAARNKALLKKKSTVKAGIKAKAIAQKAVRNARLRVGGAALGLTAIGLGAKKFLDKNHE